MKIKSIISGISVLSFFFCGAVFAQEAAPKITVPQVQNVKLVPGDQKLNVSWTKVEGAQGYRVYYGTKSVQDPKLQVYEYEVSVTDVSATLSSLVNNVNYYVAVKAVSTDGTISSLYSTELMAMPKVMVINPPKLIGIKALSSTQIKIVMSKEINIKDKTRAFILDDKYAGKEIAIQNIEVMGTNVFLSVAENSLVEGNIYRVIVTSAVEDLEGNPVASGITDNIEFTFQNPAPTTTTVPTTTTTVTTTVPVLPTTTAKPEEKKTTVKLPEVKKLKGDMTSLKEKNSVTLKWTPAVDTNIVDQIVYVQKGGKKVAWDKGISVGKNASTLELPVTLNQQYQVRLVTVDAAGNESKGVKISFSTYLLPKSGALDLAAVVGIILVFCTGVIYFSRRKEA